MTQPSQVYVTCFKKLHGILCYILTGLCFMFMNSFVLELAYELFLADLVNN